MFIGIVILMMQPNIVGGSACDNTFTTLRNRIFMNSCSTLYSHTLLTLYLECNYSTIILYLDIKKYADCTFIK